MPQSREARRALVESQRKLEQVADDFEQVGELERAFDCFQILLKLGKDSAQFENLAEGYVNCIRALRDDNLKFYVLQYYEDFIKLALERGELHAAATLYQEAAAFAARAGLPYDRHYQQKSALTWVRCAEKFVETGVPVQMVENALLAAASQHSAVGDYPAVRECFERLAGLELPERAKKRFTAIALRYKGLASPPIELPGLPDYLKQQHAYADIWFSDLRRVGDGGRSARGRGVGDRRSEVSQRPAPARARRVAHARRRAAAQRRDRAGDARRGRAPARRAPGIRGAVAAREVVRVAGAGRAQGGGHARSSTSFSSARS